MPQINRTSSNREKGADKTGGPKKKGLNLIIPAIFLVIFLLVVFLLKRDDKVEKGSQGKVPVGIAQTVPNITDLLIEPEEPSASSIVRVIPVLEIKAPPGLTFIYQWIVDGQEAIDGDEAVLPARYMKKETVAYCRVKARLGRLESKEKKSRKFTITNSPPEITRHQVEKIEVPGDFYGRVLAIDADGDPLTFNLVAPLGQGIKVDSRTGEIRWSIPALPKPDPPVFSQGDEAVTAPPVEPDPDRTHVTIVIEVTDNDDGRATISIELDLEAGREVTR